MILRLVCLPWRALCRASLFACVLATLAPSASAQVDERALKAAYLFNFIQFTRWPAPPDDPFGLCVLGSTPMDDALAALEGKHVQTGQRLTVRHIGTRDAFSGCHALYLDETQRPAIDLVLSRLAGTSILTVTDGEGLADKGMMIEIHRRDAKLVFEVNLRLARAANLTFSSRMLKLASFVAGSQ